MEKFVYFARIAKAEFRLVRIRFHQQIVVAKTGGLAHYYGDGMKKYDMSRYFEHRAPTSSFGGL
jgi:hypothetical protein